METNVNESFKVLQDCVVFENKIVTSTWKC